MRSPRRHQRYPFPLGAINLSPRCKKSPGLGRGYALPCKDVHACPPGRLGSVGRRRPAGRLGHPDRRLGSAVRPAGQASVRWRSYLLLQFPPRGTTRLLKLSSSKLGVARHPASASAAPARREPNFTARRSCSERRAKYANGFDISNRDRRCVPREPSHAAGLMQVWIGFNRTRSTSTNGPERLLAKRRWARPLAMRSRSIAAKAARAFGVRPSWRIRRDRSDAVEGKPCRDVGRDISRPVGNYAGIHRTVRSQCKSRCKRMKVDAPLENPGGLIWRRAFQDCRATASTFYCIAACAIPHPHAPAEISSRIQEI